MKGLLHELVRFCCVLRLQTRFIFTINGLFARPIQEFVVDDNYDLA